MRVRPCAWKCSCAMGARAGTSPPLARPAPPHPHIHRWHLWPPLRSALSASPYAHLPSFERLFHTVCRSVHAIRMEHCPVRRSIPYLCQNGDFVSLGASGVAWHQVRSVVPFVWRSAAHGRLDPVAMERHTLCGHVAFHRHHAAGDSGLVREAPAACRRWLGPALLHPVCHFPWHTRARL